jgi:response regulator RpfG family c-di-GMP phosphodiesterase
MRLLEVLCSLAKQTNDPTLSSEICQLTSSGRPLHPRLLELDRAFEAETIDYKQRAVLYVDDEVKSLKCVVRQHGCDFHILTASCALDGMRILEQLHQSIGVVLSDQTMPACKGLSFLTKVRELYPNKGRILVSTFGPRRDWSAAVAAAKSGLIHSYLVKPWNPAQLEQALKRALEITMVSDAVQKVGGIFGAA